MTVFIINRRHEVLYTVRHRNVHVFISNCVWIGKLLDKKKNKTNLNNNLILTN